MRNLLIFSEKQDLKIQFENKYENIIFISDEKLFINLKKCQELDIIFDFENLKLNKNNTSKYIKKIIKIEKLVNKNKINVNIINEYKIENTKNEFEAYLLIAANHIIENKNSKIEFLYDKICEFLDYQFVSKNLCDFQDNKCFAKRKYGKEMGCCHHYKNFFGIFGIDKLKLCEYQINKTCQAKCITCKMFVCDDLIKKGIIKYYFNFIKKLIIKTSFFRKKEDILKKLKKYNFVG